MGGRVGGAKIVGVDDSRCAALQLEHRRAVIFHRTEFRLREISLSFSTPPKLAAALRAHSATITLAGRNLATWTGYSGADPESGSYGIVVPGQPRTIADDGTLPVPRSWTLRLDLAY